jgi:two-component system, cell cycle response regulator DivK
MLHGKRIFIIEDDPNNRFIMQSLLEARGAVVDSERWKSDASILKLVHFLPIDLITLDLSLLNNISGFDIYRQLRDNLLFQHIPIVVVSGKEPREANATAYQLGFSGFIPKPINVKQYPQQLADIIAGQSLWYTSV